MNAALIGLGVGERHLSSLKKNPNIKKIKIFDFDKLKMKKLSKKYGVETYQNENQIYNDKSISLVCICSYDNHHFDQIVKCIKSKKHIFVEKPAVDNLKSAKKILSLLKRNKSIYFSSNYILQKYPKFLYLKSLIQNNKLGKIYYFEGDYNYGRLEKLTKGWRGKIPFYSVTNGGGSHIVDLSNFLLNDEIIEVKSFANKFVTNKTIYKYSDCVVTIAKFKSGVIGKFTSNFGCVYPHFHKINIYGTKQTFESTALQTTLYKKRDKKIVKNLKFKDKINKALILNDFIVSIKLKKNRKKYIDEVFNSLSVCFAIDKSYKENKNIKINYLK